VTVIVSSGDISNRYVNILLYFVCMFETVMTAILKIGL